MADIIAHDNAVFVDAEDKTLDKVLKQTKEDIIATYNDPKDQKVYVLYKKVDISS